jgi:hypothetical protein
MFPLLIFHSLVSRWGHIQKSTLKFSAIYQKLKKNQPSGSVLSDLVPDTKKAYYEQEGKQFIYEQAWHVLKSSAKWKNLAQTRANPETSTSTTPQDSSLPATQVEDVAPGSELNSTRQAPSESWTRPPGIHATKRLMKDEHFNAKKMKVLADRASNYREQTLQIQKTNEIRQQIARAEANHVNMEIMKQSEDDLPDDLARKFLQLQKQSIIDDLRA